MSGLFVEITEKSGSRYVVELADPRIGFCNQHNASSCDGSVARMIENPEPGIVPDMSFAKREAVTAKY